jgi:Na+/proline symporter
MGALALLVMITTTAVFTLLCLLHLGRQQQDLESYTTRRNSTSSRALVATLVASSMGAWILFAPPEAASAMGGLSALVGYALASALAVAFFAILGPRLRQLMPQGHSLTEYARHRYGKPMYWLTEGITLFYMFVYLAAELTAIAKALQLLANVPLGVTAMIVAIAVLIYTIYGGLSASIYTDLLQFLVILPLLFVAFGAAIVSLGGWGAATLPVVQAAPELTALSNPAGQKFGWTLIIAIVSAEIFNQGNWQRIYAAKSDRVLRRSFLGAAFLFILPMVIIAGLLGLFATQFGIAGDTAYFELLQKLAAPSWLLLLVMVLALSLVMSTMNALLNGMASLFTQDILQLSPGTRRSRVLNLSRLLMVGAALPAVWIAAQGYSVLYIFLIADLVCAGAVFPLLLGLYSRRIGGANALVSSIVGIAAGALFFPRPDFSPLIAGLPGGGDLLISFGGALLVSMVLSLTWNEIAFFMGKSDRFDFKRLREVQVYGEVAQPPLDRPEMSPLS